MIPKVYSRGQSRDVEVYGHSLGIAGQKLPSSHVASDEKCSGSYAANMKQPVKLGIEAVHRIQVDFQTVFPLSSFVSKCSSLELMSCILCFYIS